MQTLGLSESMPRTESRLRALVWPTIRNECDLDYVTRQGLWICFLVAALTVAVSVFSGGLPLALFEAAFYFLAGLGVRERNRVAGIAAFSAYLLGALVLQRYSGNGFNVVRIIFLALLFANIRGNWLSARWEEEPPEMKPVRLGETIGDKLSDVLPMFLWPKVRLIFYIFAGIEIALLVFFLFAPLATA